MLDFIMRLAQRPFWLGAAIGLMLNIGLVPLVRASMIPSTDTSCTQTLSVPPEVQEWVDLQCAVNTAIFDDGLEPSAAYAMDTAVEGPGLYTGQTWDERPIELDVVWTVAADLENEAPELVAEGATAQFVIALMSGIGGDVPIAGIVMQTGSLTLDEGLVPMVCDILSESEFGLFQTVAALEQGMQVWNMSTNEVGSLEMLDPDAMTLWLPGFDPSTLIQETPGGTPGPIGIAPECVEEANARFDSCAAAARATAATCIARAIRDFGLCMLLCAAIGLVAPLPWIPSLICAAACTVGLLNGLSDSADDLAIALAACWGTLRQELALCGVRIL